MSNAFYPRLVASRLWPRRQTYSPSLKAFFSPWQALVHRSRSVPDHERIQEPSRLRQLWTGVYPQNCTIIFPNRHQQPISYIYSIPLSAKLGLRASRGKQASTAATFRPLQYRTYSSGREPARQTVPQKKPNRDDKLDQSSRAEQPLKSESSNDANAESIASSVSKYLHLSGLPHRSTKEELLGTATGFWQRLKVRFKWMSIRSMRPWNADEWGAFVSWFMLGHIVWVLVGTTTFFSLLIFSINTVFAQGKQGFTPVAVAQNETHLQRC